MIGIQPSFHPCSDPNSSHHHWNSEFLPCLCDSLDELRACRPGERLTLASARRSDSAASCARGAAAAASRWSSTAWAPMPRWRWTRRRCPCGGSVMVVGLAGGTLPLTFGTFGTLPFEAQHHPPLLGQRDRARRGPRARADRPHPRARGALAARACSRGVPADARGLAQRAGRDHAQRLRPAGQTAPPTASMCRRVNAREPSM